MITELPKITTLAPWFGSARMNAKRIGQEIGKQMLVSIPFCGGCPEVLYINSRQIKLNDLHNHIIVLARTIQDKAALETMLAILDGILLHPGCLEEARHFIRQHEEYEVPSGSLWADPLWAAQYFILVWISRQNAGSDSELTSGLATRNTTSGGSSIQRWRSVVDSLQAWHKVLTGRCEFNCLDWRDWMKKTRDDEGHAIYADPPWQDAAVRYRHEFTEQDHRDLAEVLRSYEQCRVVIRHSDHPLYRELYPEWTWVEIGGRNQNRKRISECLIINGESRTDQAGKLF